MEEEEEEGTVVELANVALREEMLRFSEQPANADRTPLVMMLMATGRKVLVPVHRSEVITETMPLFGSMFKHEDGNTVELHVYTSVLQIPVTCEAQDVCFYPIAELFTDIFENGGVEILRIDPDTEHAVVVHYENGIPGIYSEKRLKQASK